MICKRCMKFEAKPHMQPSKSLCQFCRRDLAICKKLFGSDVDFSPGSIRVWVGHGVCPIDLALPR